MKRKKRESEKKARTVDLDDVLNWGPCRRYCRVERLQVLFAGRKQLSAQDIVDLPIPLLDKLWVLCHMVDGAEGRQLLESEGLNEGWSPDAPMRGFRLWHHFVQETRKVNRYQEIIFRPRRCAPRVLGLALNILSRPRKG